MDSQDRIVSWDFPDDDHDYTRISQNTDRTNALVAKLEKVERKGSSIRFRIPDEDDSQGSSTFQNPESSDATNSAPTLVTSDSSNPVDSNKNVQPLQQLKVQKGRFSIVEGSASPSESGSQSLNQQTCDSPKEESGKPNFSTCK